MAIAQLRRVLTAVLLCMPAHAIDPILCADIVACSSLLQRACLLLEGAALVAPFAASTVGGCNMSGSPKARVREDLQQSRFGTLCREHGNKAGVSQEDTQKKDTGIQCDPMWKREMMRKMDFEINKWNKEQGKRKDT